MPKETEIIVGKRDDKKKNKKSSVEIGVTGTDIFAGYIDVDYDQEWRNLSTRIPLIEKMINGDGTISELLDAIITPILSAEKSITCEDEKIKEFAKRALFDELQGGFEEFLRQSLDCVGYGFTVFEKVYKVEDGLVFWNRFAPRLQNSIERWEGKSTKWVGGHPTGITQITNSTDEADSRNVPVEVVIPWDKMILFSYKKSGNNFEGKSILRRCNAHFQIKQLLYKISAIAAERFGVGVPYIKSKKGLSPEVTDRLDDLVKNIRSNEQAYARFDEDVKEFDILVPKGNSQTGSIQDLIDHHDKKMYQSILAGFLNLDSGQGGSNALSQDQTKFFSQSLLYLANYWGNVVEEHLKQLIILNFGEQKEYPKIVFTGIEKIELSDWVEAITKSKQAGLLSWGDDDEAILRKRLKLGQAEEGAERIESKVIVNESKKELSEKKNLKPSERERLFMRNIGDFENYLASEYSNVLKIIEPEEKKLRVDLAKMYKTGKTIEVDGQTRLARNTKLESDMHKIVNQMKGRITEKLINSPLQRRLFKKVKQMAIKNVTENNKKLEEIEINEAALNSMIKGYVTNVRGFLFNGPRQIKEQITLNMGSSVEVGLAVKQAGKVQMNRNIIKLSTISHARGAYNMILFEENTKKGVEFYKTVVPRQRFKDVKPNSKTASLLWMILLAAEITRRANKDTEGKNTNAMTGLNLHHGAFAYFYPVPTEDLEKEKEIANGQREEFLETNQ